MKTKKCDVVLMIDAKGKYIVADCEEVCHEQGEFESSTRVAYKLKITVPVPVEPKLVADLTVEDEQNITNLVITRA